MSVSIDCVLAVMSITNFRKLPPVMMMMVIIGIFQPSPCQTRVCRRAKQWASIASAPPPLNRSPLSRRAATCWLARWLAQFARKPSFPPSPARFLNVNQITHWAETHRCANLVAVAVSEEQTLTSRINGGLCKQTHTLALTNQHQLERLERTTLLLWRNSGPSGPSLRATGSAAICRRRRMKVYITTLTSDTCLQPASSAGASAVCFPWQKLPPPATPTETRLPQLAQPEPGGSLEATASRNGRPARSAQWSINRIGHVDPQAAPLLLSLLLFCLFAI